MSTHQHSCDCGAPGCAPENAAAALPRRRFLTAGAAGAIALAAGGGAVLAPMRAAAQSSLTPDAALAQLMAGNARFMTTKLTSFQEDLDILRQGTVEKQEPFAAVLSCADSRVPVELVFDQTIGHVFVARVAGNFVTSELIGTLEYGATVLGTRVIMVLGHEGCGAVSAAIAGKAVPGQISAVYRPAAPGGGAGRRRSDRRDQGQRPHPGQPAGHRFAGHSRHDHAGLREGGRRLLRPGNRPSDGPLAERGR